MKSTKILISAGEVSGDSHGAKLISELRKKCELKVFSIGGRKMRDVSDYLVEDIAGKAAVGFLEAVRLIPSFLALKNRVERRYFAPGSPDRVDALILIDHPGFNVRLGKAAAARGVPVYYYITPQVWAWGKGRISVLSKICRKLYCVFDFEEELFRKAGGDVEFVGHPLLEDIPDEADISRLERETGLNSADKVLAILPGSRTQEVVRHLPVMMKAAGGTGLVPVIARPKSISEEFYREMLGPVIRVTDDTYALLKRASAAIVKSGTSTLEAAIAGVPFVTIYKVSGVSYTIAKLLVRVPYVSMVNILAGEEVSPELLQVDFHPCRLRDSVFDVLSRSKEIRDQLGKVARSLGGPGASERTARSIIESLKEHSG